MKYDDAPKFRTSVEPDSGAPEHETRKRGHILKKYVELSKLKQFFFK